MWSFDPTRYGPQVAELLQVDEPSVLGPGRPNAAMRGRLEALGPEHIMVGGAVGDRELARCCLAGLWLLHDFLDESHRISQEVDSSSGSYWHAIMHRREPDYSNAKYWFRRVGRHPIFNSLAEEAARLAGTTGDEAAFLTDATSGDPFRFVDLCQTIADGKTRYEPLARQVAQVEWQMLFDFCYQGAAGAGGHGT